MQQMFGQNNAPFERQRGILQQLMPSMPSLPMQNAQGGMGLMGLITPGGGYNKTQRFNSLPNLKEFLMSYTQHHRKLRQTMDTRDLMKIRGL